MGFFVAPLVEVTQSWSLSLQFECWAKDFLQKTSVLLFTCLFVYWCTWQQLSLSFSNGVALQLPERRLSVPHNCCDYDSILKEFREMEENPGPFDVLFFLPPLSCFSAFKKTIYLVNRLTGAGGGFVLKSTRKQMHCKTQNLLIFFHIRNSNKMPEN